MRVTARTAAGLLALGLVSCGIGSGVGPKVVATPPTAEGLLGTEWRLQDLGTGGSGGVIANTAPTLTFPQPGTVAGDASCNRFTGSADIGDGTIRVGSLAVTRRACPEPVMVQEGKYLPALEGAYSVASEGRFLLLYSKRTNEPLRFVRTKPPPNP